MIHKSPLFLFHISSHLNCTTLNYNYMLPDQSPKPLKLNNSKYALNLTVTLSLRSSSHARLILFTTFRMISFSLFWWLASSRYWSCWMINNTSFSPHHVYNITLVTPEKPCPPLHSSLYCWASISMSEENWLISLPPWRSRITWSFLLAPQHSA